MSIDFSLMIKSLVESQYKAKMINFRNETYESQFLPIQRIGYSLMGQLLPLLFLLIQKLPPPGGNPVSKNFFNRLG